MTSVRNGACSDWAFNIHLYHERVVDAPAGNLRADEDYQALRTSGRVGTGRRYWGFRRRARTAKVIPAKKQKDDSVAVAEQLLLDRTETNRSMSRFKWWPSKVPNPGSRIHYTLDRQIILRINRIIKRGGAVALTGKPPRSVLQGRIPQHRKTAAQRANDRRLTRTAKAKLCRQVNARVTKEDRDGRIVHTVYLPNWDHVSWLIKAVAYSAAIPYDLRTAATVKLSDNVIDAALRSDLGFIGYLQDRVARQLRQRFGKVGAAVPDFLITVEGCPQYSVDGVPHTGEQFHLHGICDVSWNLASLPSGFKASYPLRNALRAAGGKVAETACKNARQLHLEQAYNVPGWIQYLSKRALVTAEALDKERHKRELPSLPQEESLVGVSLGLRRRGKAWYNAARLSRQPVLMVEKVEW